MRIESSLALTITMCGEGETCPVAAEEGVSAGEEVVLFCAHFGGIRCVCGVYVRMDPVCDCNLVWIGRYTWVCLLLGSGLKWIGFDRLDWTGLVWFGLVWLGFSIC